MDFSNLKQFMDRLTEWRIPGNSIRITVDNKEVFSYHAGYSDLENKIPMVGNELFNIYSCSKVATVTAALQLYEKGYFLLDDPLYDFIPEYRDMYIKTDAGLRKAKQPITLRHLFTMTSGMSYNTATEAFERARALTEGRMDTLTVVKCLASDPLSFEPGEKWQYGLSHDVLAAVVEIISGKKFSEYVKENIFNPLDMRESYYHNDAVLESMAQQYRYVDGEESDIVRLQSGVDSMSKGYVKNVGKNIAHVFGSEYDSGGAGITTSVLDYSKFVSALANDGIGFNGERILSGKTINLLQTNQLSSRQLQSFNWEQLKGYGYGLGVRTMIDKAAGGSNGSIGEFGWGGAAGATVLVDRENRLAMFYTHHMLNPQEPYYQPRLRNVLYSCIS